MSEDGQPDEAKEWEDLEGREQDMYPSENADCSDIVNVMNKYGYYFAVLEALDMGVPCICGENLDVKHMHEFEHTGGISTPTKVKKQWVYVVCQECGMENSHKKILMRARRIYR